MIWTKRSRNWKGQADVCNRNARHPGHYAHGIGKSGPRPDGVRPILALNMFNTKTILLIAVAGFLNGRPDWLDIALVYGLVNFTGTIAVCKYVRYGNLAADDERPTQ